jgi:hypothetical protein
MTRMAAIAVGLVILWSAATAAILALTEEADAVTVVFPPRALMNGLPEGVYVLEWDGPTAVLKGTRKGYVADLYRHGAPFVLPARAAGCMTLSGDQPGRSRADIKKARDGT